MGNVTLINDQVAQGWYDSESRRPVHNLMICCTGDSESRYYVWESSDSEPGRLARPGPGLTSTIKSSQLSAAAPAATQPSARRRAPSLTVHPARGPPPPAVARGRLPRGSTSTAFKCLALLAP